MTCKFASRSKDLANFPIIKNKGITQYKEKAKINKFRLFKLTR